MDKEAIVLIIALLCLFTVILLAGLSDKFAKDNCEKNGGMYINNRICLSKEQIDILTNKDN